MTSLYFLILGLVLTFHGMALNAVHSSTNLEDKRLVIDVSVLRDFLRHEELTKFEWVHTDMQLANVFTKQGASDKLLLNVLNSKLHFNFDSATFH